MVEDPGVRLPLCPSFVTNRSHQTLKNFLVNVLIHSLPLREELEVNDTLDVEKCNEHHFHSRSRPIQLAQGPPSQAEPLQLNQGPSSSISASPAQTGPLKLNQGPASSIRAPRAQTGPFHLNQGLSSSNKAPPAQSGPLQLNQSPCPAQSEPLQRNQGPSSSIRAPSCSSIRASPAQRGPINGDSSFFLFLGQKLWDHLCANLAHFQMFRENGPDTVLTDGKVDHQLSSSL